MSKRALVLGLVSLVLAALPPRSGEANGEVHLGRAIVLGETEE